MTTDGRDTMTMRISTCIGEQEKMARTQLESDFEIAWKSYPGPKQGRAHAYDAWMKHKPKLELVLAKQEEYKAYVQHKQRFDQRYPYKHGGTWYHQQCWFDDFSLPKSSKPNLDHLQAPNNQLAEIMFRIRSLLESRPGHNEDVWEVLCSIENIDDEQAAEAYAISLGWISPRKGN